MAFIVIIIKWDDSSGHVHFFCLYDFGGDDNILEVYIGYLRKKTELAQESRLIQTVRGTGYVLRE